MKEQFEPWLGRIEASGSGRAHNYLRTIVTARARAGYVKRSTNPRFTGKLTGRGAVSASLLALRRPDGGFAWRRAVVKVRIVRLGAGTVSAALRHLHYIQRDLPPHEREPCRLYSAGEDEVDGREFLKRSAMDRHRFQLIVSVEDGAQYEDLKPLIRRLMARAGDDLGSRLEWIAADHEDTAHPHTHLILRGKDENGANLVIAPRYMSGGLSRRLEGLVSLDLGPRSAFEIDQRLQREVGAERMTSLDRKLIEQIGPEGLALRGVGNLVEHSLLIGRLCKLERLGLAQRLGGKWLVSDELEPALRGLGKRGDSLRTLQRALEGAGIERAPADQRIYRPESGGTITGRLIGQGFADERQYLIVDGVDGRSHYVAIPAGEPLEEVPEGAIVRIRAANARLVEAENRAAPDDQSASSAVAELSRQGAGLSSSNSPFHVEIVSRLPLEHLASHDGATWLDQLLLSPTDQWRDAGFGREVRAALGLRRAWLVDQGLAEGDPSGPCFRPEMIEILRAREIPTIAAGIARTTGLEFVTPKAGSLIEGRVRRRIDLASGSVMLIDNPREFSLVPWRPVLARALGREVQGRVDAVGAISWTIGRSREIAI